MIGRLEPVVTGVDLPECPRWHDGAQWFVDMQARQVLRWHNPGGAEVVQQQGPRRDVGQRENQGGVGLGDCPNAARRVGRSRPLDLSRGPARRAPMLTQCELERT